MSDESLAAALEREHHEIDAGIAAFVEQLESGSLRPEPLITALDALRRHIYLEEVFLFPPIHQGGMVMPIFVMLREHGELWHTIDALTGLLTEGADVDRLRETCRRLAGQLAAHNAKEEPVIYPHADTDLPAQTSAELARFIECGSTPAGWVCQQGAA
ncbi:hemerythrin domain-containing protein [Mycobacterium sp.]|uniref:hemerythrin domain-containing protein n=1 Tax=Mycobacterium sp. TaxID=1785 RepID=UPI003D6C2C47